MVVALKRKEQLELLAPQGTNIPIKNPWRFVKGKYLLLYSMSIFITLTVLKITSKCLTGADIP
jgi:hypothetical protein